MTSGTGLGGNLTVTFEVTDANFDGGFIYVRFRTASSGGSWSKATIISQIPSTAPGNYPNFEVFPGAYNLVWNYQADGVTSGSVVELEIIPGLLSWPTRQPSHVAAWRDSPPPRRSSPSDRGDRVLQVVDETRTRA